MNNVYKDKVRLLLRILPIVVDEECIAVNGGMAINLNLLMLSSQIILRLSGNFLT